MCKLQSKWHTYPYPFQTKKCILIGGNTFQSWKLSQKLLFRHLYQEAQVSALSGVSRVALLVAVKLSWISANATLLFSHKFFFMIKTFRSVHRLDEFILLGENNWNFRDSWSTPSALLQYVLCSSANSGFPLKYICSQVVSILHLKKYTKLNYWQQISQPNHKYAQIYSLLVCWLLDLPSKLVGCLCL